MTLVYVWGEFVPAPIQEPERVSVAGLAFLYQGRGFVPGVPARHLSLAEAEEIGYQTLRSVWDPHTGQRMYLEVPRR